MFGINNEYRMSGEDGSGEVDDTGDMITPAGIDDFYNARTKKNLQKRLDRKFKIKVNEELMEDKEEDEEGMIDEKR